MYITDFNVELVKLQTVSEVTYTIKDTDGNTLATEKKTQSWGDPAAVSSTYSYDAYTYAYNPSTIPSEETANIEVTVAPKAITDITQFSNTKAYSITTKDRGAWYVPVGGTQVTSTTKTGVTRDPNSATQQFAFINYHDRYYLYSVSENKFVAKSGQYTTLTDDATQAEVYLQATTNAFAPVVVTLSDGSQLGISNGFDPAVIAYNSLTDPGNQAAIQEAGDFDPSNVIATLDANFGYVTYIIEDSDGNELERKNNVLFAVGDVVNALPDEMVYDYTDYAGTDITVQAGSNTYKTTATFDRVPFQVSTEDVINWYKLIINGEKTRYIYANSTNANVIQTTTDGSTDYYQFAIYGNPVTGFTIKNKGKDLYINGIVTSGNGYSGTASYSETASPFGILEVDASTFRFTINSGISPYRLFAMGYYNGYNPSVTVWTDLLTTNEGKLTATLVKSEGVANVTYIVQDVNGVEKARYTKKEPIDGTLNAASLPEAVMRNFCTYAATDYTVVAGENTFTATATYNTPFEISTDFDNAHWYYLTLKDSNHPIYVSDGEDNVQCPTSEEVYDAAQWAFVGNPYEGFTIYNKEAGATMVLGSATHDPSVDTGATTHVSMATPGTRTEEKWFLNVSSYKTNGFFLRNSAGQALNQRSTTNIAYWTDDADNGSTFVATDVNLNYIEHFESDVMPYFENMSAIGTPFNVSSAGVAAVQNKLIEISTANYCTHVDCYELLEQIKENIVYPTDGFYRIKNVSNSKYMRAVKFGAFNESEGALMADVSVDNVANDIAAAIEVRTIEGKQYLLSNGAYLNWTLNWSPYYPIVSPSKDRAVEWVFNGIPGQGAFALHYNATSYPNSSFYSVTSGDKVFGASSTSASAQWIFEPATSVSVKLNNIEGDHAYATFYAPFDVEFSGATAYTVTRGGDAVDGVGSQAVITAVEGTVPAGTPVVLIADEGTASCVATIKGTDAEALSAENILSGHYFAGTVAENSLVFGKANGVAGFYKYADYATVLGANRAFIAPEEAASVRALVFVDPTTGISSSLFNTEDGTAYDLQGRRVNNTSKGLYILNGKKVLVK